MLFNSSRFIVLFIAVTVAYYVLPRRARWLMLLAASCVFYMAFVPAYILILAATILVDYRAGIYMETSVPRRHAWLVGSIICTVAILFVFKYFNFCNDNVAALARLLHWNYGIASLRLVLPIGLSFPYLSKHELRHRGLSRTSARRTQLRDLCPLCDVLSAAGSRPDRAAAKPAAPIPRASPISV